MLIIQHCLFFPVFIHSDDRWEDNEVSEAHSAKLTECIKRNVSYYHQEKWVIEINSSVSLFSLVIPLNRRNWQDYAHNYPRIRL